MIEHNMHTQQPRFEPATKTGCSHYELHNSCNMLSTIASSWLLLLQISTLVGMWLIPVVLSLRFYWWRFITIWSVFSLITGFVSFKATRKPIAGTTPRSINQSIKVICNARNVVHRLKSEVRAVASGRVLLMVIEKVGHWVTLSLGNTKD